MTVVSVVFAIGLTVGFAVGYAVRAAISLRHRQAAMKRRYLPSRRDRRAVVAIG